ncbi:Probable receptor-like protein kinase [Striga hermonthica]|uniref:non-specific serine/threonine protein kinase n=1 Tax=Striga hermonthica TaxID=68872 RepID=A0A9N7P4W7_STRHE|nr:Probable receptor-like protein kinase [Striga hermonthica]
MYDDGTGHKQWVAEVQFLGVVDHPNLVNLIGYCAVDGERGIQRLLVYEYMLNKSLEYHLFNRAHPALSWDRRLQIMLGAAQGLAYLHQDLEIQVIYRDFKASQVLLDNEFNPKLSDFGLAREGPTASLDITKLGYTGISLTNGLFSPVGIGRIIPSLRTVVGTYGYAAPDYIVTGHLTSKSEVWSFGVVLYEVLTGRRSLERDRPRGEQNLLEWVKQYPADSRKFSTIIDPRLDKEYSLSAARKMAKLADSCLVKSARDRLEMSKVVETLKQILGCSGEESPLIKDEDDKKMGVSESAKRRMAQ